jgi:hypothetical protein
MIGLKLFLEPHLQLSLILSKAHTFSTCAGRCSDPSCTKGQEERDWGLQ